MIHLTRIRPLGRYVNPETGHPVNVHKGARRGRGTDHLFYLLRGRRILIADNEFRERWVEVKPL